MANYEIKPNPCNFGLCARFFHNNRLYLADLCFIPRLDDTECMIFDITEAGQLCFGNAIDLYCKRGIPVTEESLTACIEEFIQTLNK